jgi:hypothetical protein
MAYTTIDNPELFFQTLLHVGNNTSFTFAGSENMQPDLIWNKNRDSSGYDHHIIDSVRGVSKLLRVSSTIGEFTSSDSITAIGSDGFTVGADGNGYVASGTDKQVSWCWKESTTAGFDIVTYTGNGVEGRNISHSLGAKPHWMIVKNRDSSVKWAVYHEKNTSAPGTDHLQLNSDAATSDDDSTWDDTEPTSSVFRVKGSSATNGSSVDYIAYLWAPIQGFSKFSSYTGNGNADGPFVYTGFKPAFVIAKLSSSSGGSWNIFDNKREGYNVDNDALFADVNGAETTTDYLDFLSNGFKIRRNSSDINTSGETYIYMAFAESPFVNSNGVPNNTR